MHQRPAAPTPHQNYSWLWILAAFLLLSGLIWFGYTYYKNSQQPEPAVQQPILETTRQEQQDSYQQFKTAAPTFTPAQLNNIARSLGTRN